MSGERYCTNCKAAVLAELRDSRFVRDVKGPRSLRTLPAREDVVETKFGVDD